MLILYRISFQAGLQQNYVLSAYTICQRSHIEYWRMCKCCVTHLLTYYIYNSCAIYIPRSVFYILDIYFDHFSFIVFYLDNIYRPSRLLYALLLLINN